MKRLRLIIGLYALLGAALAAAVPDALAQSTVLAAASTMPLGLTVEDAYGDTLRYDFGTTAGGRHFHLDVVFRPDEVEWWELWDGGTSETDPTKAVRLDAHRLLASWPEANGWFITLYADFARGETSFCGTDGASSQCRTGTITRANAGRDAQPSVSTAPAEAAPATPADAWNYQTGAPANWPPELDAVSAAPANHRVLLAGLWPYAA